MKDSMTDVKRGGGTRADDTGVVFIGPIIGITDSLKATFGVLTEQGVHIEYIDIFDEAHEKKSFFKVIGLTILPGKDARLIRFANRFNEDVVFDKIAVAIRILEKAGKKRIILGGMSGGFVFASRIAQSPVDEDLRGHQVREHIPQIAGIFGVSPIVFYPPEVSRKSADLRAIPPYIPTLLIFGDQDDIIPKGTISHCQEIQKREPQVQVVVLRNGELGGGPIRHQFFGGKDFIGFLKNIYWHPVAEKHAVQQVRTFITGRESDERTP